VRHDTDGRAGHRGTRECGARDIDNHSRSGGDSPPPGCR
jgi:hypothetical protein